MPSSGQAAYCAPASRPASSTRKCAATLKAGSATRTSGMATATRANPCSRMSRKARATAGDHIRAAGVFPPRRGGAPQGPAPNDRSSDVALHVLMVDDDELNVRLVRRVLEARGFSVESASSGMEALAAVDRRRPDV